VHTSDEESREELLGLAAAAGFDVTAAQLARWHRAGLIPRPSQRPLGKGHGTETVYPGGTGEQLLALARILALDRRLSLAAWELWWAGYDVSLEKVRTLLGESAKSRDASTAELRARIDAPGGSDSIYDLADRMAGGRTDVKVLRQARKRVGRSSYSTVAKAVLETAAGRFGGFEPDAANAESAGDGEILERALGLERARTDRLPDADPWLAGPADGALLEISALAAAHRLSDVLTSTVDRDLIRYRDELKVFVSLFGSVSEATEDSFGPGAFGFGAFPRWFSAMTSFDRITFMLVWILFRRHGGEQVQEGYSAIVATAGQWQTEALPAYRSLKLLRSEVPEVAENYSPARMRRAMRSTRARAKWFDELREMRSQNAAKLDAFFAKYPAHLAEPNSLRVGGRAAASRSAASRSAGSDGQAQGKAGPREKE
jgi:hypothetical protein